VRGELASGRLARLKMVGKRISLRAQPPEVDDPADTGRCGRERQGAGGEAIALTPLEFELLVTLAQKPNQVFSREMLLEQVWGYHYKADTRLVNVHVQRLRAKIEADPASPELVQTVRGVGYKLVRPSEDP